MPRRVTPHRTASHRTAVLCSQVYLLTIYFVTKKIYLASCQCRPVRTNRRNCLLFKGTVTAVYSGSVRSGYCIVCRAAIHFLDKFYHASPVGRKETRRLSQIFSFLCRVCAKVARAAARHPVVIGQLQLLSVSSFRSARWTRFWDPRLCKASEQLLPMALHSRILDRPLTKPVKIHQCFFARRIDIVLLDASRRSDPIICFDSCH